MNIREFLDETGMSGRKMAIRCGATFHQLYNLMRGGRPSLKLALAIEEYTKGKVCPRDFLNEKEVEEIYGSAEKDATKSD